MSQDLFVVESCHYIGSGRYWRKTESFGSYHDATVHATEELAQKAEWVTIARNGQGVFYGPTNQQPNGDK